MQSTSLAGQITTISKSSKCYI